MKRILYIFGLLVVSISLSGCGETKDLTEEQMNLIAEYSAGLVLNQEDAYEKRLEKEEAEKANNEAEPTPASAEATPAPTATPTSKPAQIDTAADNNNSDGGSTKGAGAKDVSMTELFGVKGLSVDYKDYLLTDQYPKKDTAYTMRAIEGEKYFIARFNIKNTKSGTLSVDTRRNGTKYYLNLNGTDYEAAISIQKNGGLNMLKTKLAKSKSDIAIVSFNVPSSISSVDSATLSIVNEKKKTRCIIKCK